MIGTPMTGAELLEMTEGILDGQTIDETLFYNLLDVAKNRREEGRPWMMLRKLDSSQSAGSGNNSQTQKALPTDWRETYKLFVGPSTEYFPIEFEEQHRMANSSGRYFIDVGSETFSIVGNVSVGGTIYHYYKKTTPKIEEDTSPVWPGRFHAILAYDVAGYFMSGVDADDLYARMSPENKLAALQLTDAMATWDARLQNAARGNQQKVAGAESELPLGSM